MLTRVSRNKSMDLIETQVVFCTSCKCKSLHAIEKLVVADVSCDVQQMANADAEVPQDKVDAVKVSCTVSETEMLWKWLRPISYGYFQASPGVIRRPRFQKQ